MSSQALQHFNHAIQDSTDLLNHFDALNTKPPPPDIEVLKRASLVMALAALETYFEDRIVEAVDSICQRENASQSTKAFYQKSLETDLKFFHSPSTDRVCKLYKKYLEFDISEAWTWNHYDSAKAKAELDRLVKKRGDIAHRSLRPGSSESQPVSHAVTREALRKHINFIGQIAISTDKFLAENI